MVPSRFVGVSAARVRFHQRVDRLAPFLMRVDPLADEVVAALDAAPGREGWALFAKASQGDITPDVPEALRAFLREAESVPLWVDWETIDRGCDLMARAAALGGLVLGLKSLPLAYASPGGNKPLIFSGRLTDDAARRLNETARFVRATVTPGALKPRAEGWRVTLKVRLIHAHVRRMLLRSGRWDEQAWGAPINQHDEAGTLLLFSSTLLEGLRQLGMHIGPEDAEAYMHLWRWSGTLMGVDPELISPTEGDGLRLFELLVATQAEPDDDSRALTRALIESPLRTAVGRSPREVATARRAVAVSRAICRRLVGDELADRLGVPPTPWRFALPVVERVVSGLDQVRQRMPRGAVSRAGRAYWDRVAAVGLAEATAQFAIPDRLTGAPSKAEAAV